MEKQQLNEISNRIKQCRNKIGLTQEEVAEKIGLTYSSYTKIENGLVGLSIETLLKIAEFYDISLDFLIYGGKDNKVNSSDVSKIKKLINLLEKSGVNNTINVLENLMNMIQKDKEKN